MSKYLKLINFLKNVCNIFLPVSQTFPLISSRFLYTYVAKRKQKKTHINARFNEWRLLSETSLGRCVDTSIIQVQYKFSVRWIITVGFTVVIIKHFE